MMKETAGKLNSNPERKDVAEVEVEVKVETEVRIERDPEEADIQDQEADQIRRKK